MLEVIRTPELAAEVTLLPVDSFGLDAAIVFSDILPPLVGMGLELDFVKGDGPRDRNPISTPRDVDLLGTPPAEETMTGTLEAIRIVRRELEPRGRPCDRLRRRPVHARELRDRGRDVEGLHEDEGVHALRARGVEAPPRASSSPCRPTTSLAQARGGRAGAAGVRLVGRAVRSAARTTCATSRRTTATCSRRSQRRGVPVINFSLGVGVVPRRSAPRAAATSSASTGRFRSTRRGSASASTAPCRETSTRRRCSRRGASSGFRIDDVLERAAGRPGHVFNVGHGLTPADARSTTCAGWSSTCGSAPSA